jgi:hypothetical protein
MVDVSKNEILVVDEEKGEEQDDLFFKSAEAARRNTDIAALRR